MDQVTQFIQAITGLLQAISWPLLVLFLILFLGEPIKKYLSSLGDVSAKVTPTGIEFSAKKSIEAAYLLGAAQSKSETPDSPAPTEDNARAAAAMLSKVSSSPTNRGLEESHILWVDDRPDNNVYERRALSVLGVQFTLSRSTEDALEKLHQNRDLYNVIISDMGRPPDPQAGYTLLECLQKEGFRIPYIIYAGSNLPEHKRMAREKGAFGTTNNPQELFQMVTDALERP